MYVSVRRVELVNPGGKGTRGIFFPINSIDKQEVEEWIVADRVQVCLRDDSAVIFGALRLRSFDTWSTVRESLGILDEWYAEEREREKAIFLTDTISKPRGSGSS